MKKILIIRFSSFGDVIQCLSVAHKLKEKFANEGSEIHWVTREDMAPLIENHPAIKNVWKFDSKTGARGLLSLILKLRAQNFSLVYDAHNNLRSNLILLILRPLFFLEWFKEFPNFIQKSQKRWRRFLLFQLRINRFRLPFSGQRDLLEPLAKWGISESLPDVPQIFVEDKVTEELKTFLSFLGFQKFVVLAPSSAHILKRWPIEYWNDLINHNSQFEFIITGGPSDDFLKQLEIAQDKGAKVLNLAGQTSFKETIALIKLSQMLITNDTGVLHIAEQFGKPTIALMGPAPFGFPSRDSTTILQMDLPCRPCSKHGQGPCRNRIYHQCLKDILPSQVSKCLNQMMRG